MLLSTGRREIWRHCLLLSCPKFQAIEQVKLDLKVVDSQDLPQIGHFGNNMAAQHKLNGNNSYMVPSETVDRNLSDKPINILAED
jgi:hypothetical protein